MSCCGRNGDRGSCAGAYALTAYGGLLTVWLLARLVGSDRFADFLLWPCALLAVIAAVYTAFLFAQAKGRDFWQNPLLSIHLLAHAMLAGSAIWLIVDGELGVPLVFDCDLIFSIVALFAEILTTPPTADAHRAMHWIIGKPMGGWFWIGGLSVGHLLPLVLLWSGVGTIAALLALAACS